MAFMVISVTLVPLFFIADIGPVAIPSKEFLTISYVLAGRAEEKKTI